MSLLYYCVKHIYGQFKTYLKLRNIRLKQIAKTIPTVGKSRDILFKTILFCIDKYLNLYDTISFDVVFSLCCTVAWGCIVLLTYCVFETCKVKSVLKLLYFERYSFTFHFTKFFSHFLNKFAKEKLFFNSKSSEKVIPSLCLYSKQKSRKLTL
jgi:hypothetical protein